eukprot:TRINITY_DN3881_c1_g1_i1.p1 TRINITY_DN3881_c1_g1~~TRINITY_DN3881_c1_g1_i1.p1  ORF type:complete len:488 (+),score=58.31 TRINITY_DN3881_c1_g1_i1:147-1610(+)
MEATDGAVIGGTLSNGSETRPDLLPPSAWLEYLREAQLAAERHVETQTKLTEMLLRRLQNSPPTVGEAAATAPEAVLNKDLEYSVGGTWTNNVGVAGQSTSQPTREAEWRRIACRTRLHLEKPGGDVSESIYKVMKNTFGAFGADSKIMRQLSLTFHHVEPNEGGKIQSMVTSRYFEFLSSVVIAVNICFIVLGANASMQEVSSTIGRSESLQSDDTPVTWTFSSAWVHMVDAAFLSFYVVELALRLYTHKTQFWIGTGCGWNVFDLILVFVSIAGVGFSLLKGNGYSSSSVIFALRSTRVARVAKVMRVARVVRAARVFKELQVFVDVVLGCYVHLFWSVIMINLVLLLFAIYFVQSFESWIAEAWSPGASEEVQGVVDEITEHFGSVHVAMVTLWKTISGGVDWEVVYDLTRKTSIMDMSVFLSMILFFALAVLNIVASVFVENTLRAASVDRDEQVLAQHRVDVEDARALMYLCRSADIDTVIM